MIVLKIVFLQTKWIKGYTTVKILTNTQAREWDQYTIEHEPVASLDLMERAAQAVTEAITRRWNKETQVKVFAGCGNNGGDALAVARLLNERGYKIEAYLFNIKGNLSSDCETNRDLLTMCEGVTFTEVTSRFVPPQLEQGDLVIDGLFGSGLSRPLEKGFAGLVEYINRSKATVVSIDVPSGLMGEDNTGNNPHHIVRADLTLVIQQKRLSFYFAENQPFLGEVEVLDIHLAPEYLLQVNPYFAILEREELAPLIRPRDTFSHKGTYGHGLLIAGRVGMAGASVLAAKAALRSGIGLLTVHAPVRNNDILQTAVPEAMIDLDDSDDCFVSANTEIDRFQGVAIGPGLGRSYETGQALFSQIQITSVPMIVDADAINMLALDSSILKQLPKGSILTPHPKEFDRLAGACSSTYERIAKARAIAKEFQLYIVLKGAWTAVVAPQGTIFLNPTGNPGMATGGSGDVLTGILLALVAQGYDALSACCLGVYVHGLAADLAAERLGQISMTAGDLIDSLPEAWKKMTQP